MSLDAATVRRIARLARLGIGDGDVERLKSELSGIVGWIEQLTEVDVEGVEPLAAIGHAALRLRADEVTDGNQVEAVLANAPDRAGPYYCVPKVVE